MTVKPTDKTTIVNELVEATEKLTFAIEVLGIEAQEPRGRATLATASNFEAAQYDALVTVLTVSGSLTNLLLRLADKLPND